MDNKQLLETYFNIQNLQGTFWDFYADLALTALLTFILGRIYIRFGSSISNRKQFSSNFLVISLTTMLIISIIKSSLALSLGLVGALSIVRFRSAIKEPEELAYLFLSISVGLGFGAGQRYITVLAFSFIVLILIVRGLFTKSDREQNLFLTVSSRDTGKVDLEKIVSCLKNHASLVKLRRVDKDPNGIEIILYVKFRNLVKLNKAEEAIRDLDKDLKISFVEDMGVFN